MPYFGVTFWTPIPLSNSPSGGCHKTRQRRIFSYFLCGYLFVSMPSYFLLLYCFPFFSTLKMNLLLFPFFQILAFHSWHLLCSGHLLISLLSWISFTVSATTFQTNQSSWHYFASPSLPELSSHLKMRQSQEVPWSYFSDQFSFYLILAASSSKSYTIFSVLFKLFAYAYIYLFNIFCVIKVEICSSWGFLETNKTL